MLSITKGKGQKRQKQYGEDVADTSDPAFPQADQLNLAGDAPIQATMRHEQIACLAYYKAQQRGFQGGNELDDWLAAERELDAT